jgi:hypothetical protein
MDENEREDLRTTHKVRPLTDAEDGSGLSRLPNGVYGFTYSPGPRDFPLFQAPRAHNFEVHKLPDGATHLVGFVYPETVALLANAGGPFQVKLFPGPRDGAEALVSIPAPRVIRFHEYSTREGGGLDLELEPQGSAAS